MLIERLMKVALLGSEWVLYGLLFLSVVSFSTMFERWLYFRRRSDDLVRVRKELTARLADDDIPAAEQILEKSPALEARVAREGLRWRIGGPGAISDAVDSELARLKPELERGTNFLGTVGNNAPFVGLFGTVLGVIIAFHALGSAGQNTSQMGGVMAGIAEALVATGVGLFVALPAVVAYNLIQKRIGEVESNALSFTKLLTAYVKAHRATAPGSAEAAGWTAGTTGADDAPDDENSDARGERPGSEAPAAGGSELVAARVA